MDTPPIFRRGLEHHVLLGVAGYLYLVLLLSYGITATVIAGLPLHSLVLLLGLFVSVSSLRTLPLFMLLSPLLLVGGIVRLLTGPIDFFAIRDMGTVIEMQWIFVGWALAYHGIIDSFLRRITVFMLPCALYWNMLSFSGWLRGVGPRVGLHGTGLFGTFNQVHVPPFYYAALAIYGERMRRPMFSVMLSMLFVLRMMARHAIAGFFLVNLWLLLKRQINGRMAFWMMFGSCGALIFILFFDIEISTRFGTLGDIIGNILAIVFDAGDVKVFERGFSQRFEWWGSGLSTTSADPWTFLFGQGYGVVLTDHAVIAGIPTRELHNSWLSLFCRLGITGFSLFVVYTWILFSTILRSRNGLDRMASLFVCLVIMVMMSSLFEPAFENPNIASLIWVTTGVFLHHRLRSHASLPRP